MVGGGETVAYKVFKKEIGKDAVELLNDKVYETKEEAEEAMLRAQNELTNEREEVPLPGEVFGPGQTAVPGAKIVTEENTSPHGRAEFFIREV